MRREREGSERERRKGEVRIRRGRTKEEYKDWRERKKRE